MTEKKDHAPLLYIYQPFSKTPSIKMQNVYTSKQAKDVKKEEPVEEEPKEEAVPIEVTIGEEQEVEEQDNEQQKFSFKRVKSFKEMNVKEKLEYLKEFPKMLPPVPCVFYAKDRSYQGYLQEYHDQELTIKFHDKTTKTIPVSALKDVIMIGIKK